MFGRSGEQQSAANGSRRGCRRGTPRPDLPVREEESIPDGHACCGELWVWMEGDERDRHLCPEDSAEAAAPGLRTGKGGRRPGPVAAVSTHGLRAYVLAERYGLHRPLRSDGRLAALRDQACVSPSTRFGAMAYADKVMPTIR